MEYLSMARSIPGFTGSIQLKHLKKMLYWPLQYVVLRDALAVFFTAESERDLAKVSFRPNKWNSVVVPFGINDPEESAGRSRRPDRDVLSQISRASLPPLSAVPGPHPCEEGLRLCCSKRLDRLRLLSRMWTS